jgi:hypothetical protein
MSVITLIPSQSQVTIDSQVASGVDMSALDTDILAIKWFGTGGEISYTQASGESGLNTVITSITPYQAYIDEAAAIINAQNNPVTYYTLTEPLGQPVVVTAVGWPQPPNTTELIPPAVPSGQTLYWYESAWVVSSFDPALSLPQAKTSLISTVTQDGASAVNRELGLYSNVQQITAGDVLTLDCVNFPGSTIGEYQTFVDGVIASETAYINAQTSTESLYSYNPAYVPVDPSACTYSGTLQSNRNGDDMNPSYMATFTCSYSAITAADLVIYVPSSDTTLPYLPSQVPPGWDSFGGVFVGGDYTIQLKYGPLVIASFILNNRSNQAWAFSYPPATTYTQVSGGGNVSQK